MRRATLTSLLLAGLLLPATAQAGSIHLTGTAGPAAEVFPLYRAAPGERNKVTITLGRKGLTIVDTGVRRIGAEKRKHPLCRRRSARKFFCPHMFFVEAKLGDRGDSIRYKPAGAGSAPTTTDPLALAEPDFSFDEGAPDARTFVYGGDGNDRIAGSSSTDDIYPGSGRDTVSGRGARDTIVAGDDGAPDTIHGDGGIDSVYFSGKRPVSVDLAAGTGGGDKLSGIERVHGTDKGDTLLGSDRGDALYGEGGGDTIDGRGGNDLVIADSPFGDGAANKVTGGDGDDVIDVLRTAPTAGSSLDCGVGADRVAAGLDDFLPDTCESAVYVVSSDFESPNGALFKVPLPSVPVATDADGPTFEIPCPPKTEVDTSGCNGKVTLESPPVPGSSAEPTSYGSASFDLAPGQRTNVKVTLDTAGQAARTAGSPVAVHVTATLPIPGQVAPDPVKADFGWQVVLPR